MKNITLISILILIIFSQAKSQDSLTISHLEPNTYVFNIEKGILTGEGANFLIKEMSISQYVMIGEYHGSYRISKFTSSIIPILDSLGCKTMVLEVGPISGQFLNKMSSPITHELKLLNDKYLTKIKEDIWYGPIPFFANIEDGQFLEKTKHNNWNIIGIDQEFSFGYRRLIDQMFENLSPFQKKEHQILFETVIDSMNYFTSLQKKTERLISISIVNSPVIERYFKEMSIVKENKEIVETIRKSCEIYNLNTTQKWYESNRDRVLYMKYLLRKQLEESKFDLEKDKLLIKMGGRHLAKGFSDGRFYEIGNTLNELAEYYGNTSLNIAFSNRFYIENGELYDILDSKSEYDLAFKELNQMGKENEWVVIDLRPMIKGYYYYPEKYKFNKDIEDLVKQYDLLIIPRTEIDPKPNYYKN